VLPGRAERAPFVSCVDGKTITMVWRRETTAVSSLKKAMSCIPVCSKGSSLRIAPERAQASHVIVVSSMSEAYGVPRIRVGRRTTTDPSLQETFIAAKGQISTSGSILGELVAEQILVRRDEVLPKTEAGMRHRRDSIDA